MKIDGSVALVTGANRGLGRVYARELVRGGGFPAGWYRPDGPDPYGVTLAFQAWYWPFRLGNCLPPISAPDQLHAI